MANFMRIGAVYLTKVVTVYVTYNDNRYASFLVPVTNALTMAHKLSQSPNVQEIRMGQDADAWTWERT